MVLNRPSTWQNGPIHLYHGTLVGLVPSVIRGVDPTYFKPLKDFGRGFYVTTSLRQAMSWAESLADQTLGTDRPAVLVFSVGRDDLASLDTLAFVRGEYDAEEFWSFVWHCRQNDTDHGRPLNGGWYDVVIGPVAAFWGQRALYAGSDQMSFHTPKAVSLLTASNPRQVR